MFDTSIRKCESLPDESFTLMRNQSRNEFGLARKEVEGLCKRKFIISKLDGGAPNAKASCLNIAQ